MTKVSCYSGFTYAERPLSFVGNGQTFKITAVENTWIEPGKKHFKVGTDDTFFELCYDELKYEWSVTNFN